MDKVCSRCGVCKPLEAFYRDSFPRNKTGRQSRCIECCKRDSATYRKAHPEWKADRDRAYRKRYPEKDRELSARKRAANPDKYRAISNASSKRYTERNSGYRLKGNAERIARWRKKYPGREREMKRLRNAPERMPAWADLKKIEVVYRKAAEYGFEVDHIVPMKHPLVTGLHVWHNLQLLDRNLNRVKCNRSWPDMPNEAAT